MTLLVIIVKVTNYARNANYFSNGMDLNVLVVKQS